MSFSRTYAHNVLVAVDSFLAALFFNRPDLTISALCGIVLRAKVDGGEWQWRVERVLKFNRWQIWILRGIGYALNLTFRNHCEAARVSDLTRAASTLKLLDDPSDGSVRL